MVRSQVNITNHFPKVHCATCLVFECDQNQARKTSDGLGASLATAVAAAVTVHTNHTQTYEVDSETLSVRERTLPYGGHPQLR